MSNNLQSLPKPRFLALVVGLMGIALFYQGLLLLLAGGSFYYLLARLSSRKLVAQKGSV